jgi:hypothetical protein
MTTEPAADDYPSQWQPRERRERDEAAGVNPLEMELALAAMDPGERAAMLQRIEAMK